MELTPVQPRRDETAADTGTLEQMGVLPEQPVADPAPPPPPDYELASPA